MDEHHLEKRRFERPSRVAALSGAQRRMWFLHQMQPEHPAYTVVSPARIDGRLQTVALARAVKWLVTTHEALRATFPMRNDIPTMAIWEPEAFDTGLEFASLDETLDGTDERIADFVTRYARTAFHLTDRPPARFILGSLNEELHVLLILQHHIITDGWSINILWRDLAAAYQAFASGQEPAFRPGPSLSAFSELELADEERQEEDLKFWRKALVGLPTTALPFARTRTPEQHYDGESLHLNLSKLVSDRIVSLANAHRASPYMVVAAAVATVYARLTDQTEIVFGSPHANRDRYDFENVVGLFVNSFVVRVDVPNHSSFTDVLAAVRSWVLNAADHLSVPLERIVEELQDGRALSHNPLFQTLVTYQSTTEPFPNLAGTTVVRLDVNSGTTRFDLEWTFYPMPTGLRVRLTWNVDLFGRNTVTRLATIFENLLDSLLGTPDLPVSSHPLLSYTEASRLVRICPTAGAQRSISQMFAEAANLWPDNTALSWADSFWSFKTLDRAAGTFARLLAEVGVGTNSIVALYLPRGPLLIAGILGTWKRAAAFVPLDADSELITSRTAFMLSDSGAHALAVLGNTTVPINFRGKVVRLDPDPDKLARGIPQADASSRSQDLAYILYTSGTTGEPKGVLVEQGNLANTLTACQGAFGFSAEGKFPVLAPHTFDIFYFELLSPLLSGGEAMLVNRQELLTPSLITAVLIRATYLQAVPGLMRGLLTMMKECGVKTANAMRQVTTGGDRVPPSLLDELQRFFPNAEISVTYGPTETAILATRHVQRGPASGHPIGTPLPGVMVLVVDKTFHVVPDGIEGEILIGGAGVARGYLNRPEEQSQRFVLREGERFYLTGDRGFWRDDGVLEFCGRRDQQLKIHGFRIEAGEVEAHLRSCPEVDDCAVVGLPDPTGELSLVAYVVCNESNQHEDWDQINNWRHLFNVTHEHHSQEARDFSGWNSKLTGEPLPLEEMEEWLVDTVRVLKGALAGKRRPRILEIGCGTGLLLFELASTAERYDACDFSEVLVNSVNRKVEGFGWTNVEVVLAEATEIPFSGRQYDLVIINSVVQYFPNRSYLESVMKCVVPLVANSGILFIGDVRNLQLRDIFNYSIEASRAVKPSFGDLARYAIKETELLIDPRFFVYFAENSIGRSCSWRISPKLSQLRNELSLYRFDVTLKLDETPQKSVTAWLQWPSEGLSKNTLEMLFRKHETVGFLRSPNSRLHNLFNEVHEVINSEHSPSSKIVEAVDPHLLATKMAEWGFSVAFSWASGYPDGSFDILVSRLSNAESLSYQFAAPKISEREPLTNEPTHAGGEDIEAKLRESLKNRLPEYMVPALFELVDEIPLTANGKVNRAGLRAPAWARPSQGLRPQTSTQIAIASIWEQVLGIRKPTLEDNFFRLGGSSLSAIQVAVRLRKIGFEVRPQLLFHQQTLSELSSALDRGDVGTSLPVKRLPSFIRGKDARPARYEQRLSGDQPIILTGATGFLGSHLLLELLKRTSRLILCPIRADTLEGASRRLVESMTWHFPDLNLGRELGARVYVYPHDLVRSPFDASKIPLFDRADTIFHVAADVRHLAPREELFLANVEATRNVLAWASIRGASVHHVSSVGVKGVWSSHGEAPTLTERGLSIGQSFIDDYSESKFAAECIIRDFADQGHEVSVYRAGTVAPHSKTGRFQRLIANHFFTRFLKITVDLGLASLWEGKHFSLMPVDVVADAIVDLADLGPSGKNFHLVTPHQVDHGWIITQLRRRGFQIRICNREDLHTALIRQSQNDDPQSMTGALLNLFDTGKIGHVSLNADWTHRELEKVGFSHFLPTEEWFERFLNHCVEVNFLQPPSP